MEQVFKKIKYFKRKYTVVTYYNGPGTLILKTLLSDIVSIDVSEIYYEFHKGIAKLEHKYVPNN